MDDPLVGLTIWQSAQPNKKRPVREGFLISRNEGVGAVEQRTILNGMGSGKKTVNNGSRRKEGKKGGRGKRETAKVCEGADHCFPCPDDVGKERVRIHGRADVNSSNGEEEEEECELTESSMLCREGEGGRRTPPAVVGDRTQFSSPVPQPQNFWLMRLFQSKLFDMSIAIGYFFKSKETDVQAYLGHKLYVSFHGWYGNVYVVCMHMQLTELQCTCT